MEDKPLFTQPTTDLFSTAVLAAKGQGKKNPAMGPTPGRVQGKQGGPELPSLMSLQLRATGSAVGSLANDNTSKQDPTNVNMQAEALKPDHDDDSLRFELLKQKIFAARMMGAPATVANDIVSSFHMKESSSSSLFSLGSQQRISSSSVQSQAGNFSIQQQQQQQITTLLAPAQQAQARMIATALFNSIKPILPTSATTTSSITNQEQQQQQQLPLELQETLAQIKVQQQQQQLPLELQETLAQIKVQQQEKKLLEEKQEFQTPLQKTLSLLKLAQLQQQPVTSQQQRSSEKITPFSSVGQTQPPKWSNRSQKTAVVQTGKVIDKLGKPSSSSSSTWLTDTTLTTSNLSTSNPQYTPVKSNTDILNISKQRDPRLSSSVDRNLANTAPSRPTLATEPVVLSNIEPPKLNLLGKVPVSVGSPSTQTIEVLESLKNDGYIDSPPGSNTSGIIDPPKGKILDKNSTSWQGTLGVGTWKTPKPVPKPKDLRLNTGAVTKTTYSSQAPMSSTNFQGALLNPKQTSHSLDPVNKSTDAWQDSVDAFLQVTNRSGESKWKSAESRGRKRLHETQPIPVPTARLLPSGAQVETPFLSETDTEETISIIDRRVEMLRMQKVQILQDQMEEFYREIQEFDKEIEESQPASKQRKKKKTDQGLTSSDKDKGNYRQKELEKYNERESDKHRERDKGGDDDRRRRSEKRSPSKSKKSLSRDREEKRLRSPSYHREESRKREGSHRSSTSPKRARSRSREDSSKDSKSSKDAPMEMRQGRYPSKSGERRSSVSPERKKKKIDTKAETFREGRWQFASKVFDRKRGFRLGFGREKKKIEIRLKRYDTKKEAEKEKKDGSSKTSRKSTKTMDTNNPKLETKKDKTAIKKADKSSSDSKSSVSRTASNPHRASSEIQKKDTDHKISTKTGSVSTSCAQSSSVSEESTKTSASMTKSDTVLSSTLTASIDSSKSTSASTVVSSTAASHSSVKVSTSSSSGLANNATALKYSTNSSKLSTKSSSTSASSSKAVTKRSAASTNTSTASTSSSETKSSMSSSKTAIISSTSSTKSSTTSTKMSTSTKVPIPSTSKCSTNKPTMESSTTDEDTKDSVDEQKAKRKKKAEVEVLTEADATLASSSLADEIKESSIAHQLGLLRQLQIDKHVEDKVLVDWFCYVCGTICHTLKVYTVHIAGRKHKTIYEKLLGFSCKSGIKNKLIAKLNMLPMKGADPMTIANMAGALRGNLSNVPSVTLGTTLPESKQSFQCGQCFRPYTCSYQEHLLSEEHKKFEKIRPRCNVCNMIFQKIVQYRKHLISPSHKKKMRAMATGVSKVQKTSKEDYTNKSDSSNSNDKSGVKTHLIGSEFVIPISGFFCKLCSKFYNKEKTAKDVHCATSFHIAKAKQHYASRNLSTGTSFKACLGNVNETKPPGTVKETKTLGASILVKTPKTVSTAPTISKRIPTGMNVLMKSKSPETCASIKDSSEGKSVGGGIPLRKVPTVETQTMSIPSRVSVRLSGRRTRSATTKAGSLITLTKTTDVTDIKASEETDMETVTITTEKGTAEPGEEELSVKTRLKAPSLEMVVPIGIKPNQRESEEILPAVAQNPQTIHKETKVNNINLKDSDQAQETKSKDSTVRRDEPKDAPPKDIPSKEQAHQAALAILTSKTSDLKETLPIASPKSGTPARAQTMRTRSKKVTPPENFTSLKSNNSSVMGTSTSIELEVPTKPLPSTKVISKEPPVKWTVLKNVTPKDVMLKGSLPQVSTIQTNPTDPGRVESKETTPKAVPPKVETSRDVATKKSESREAIANTKPESLPKGAIPKDLTFQKTLPKDAAVQKPSPKNITSALNVNPSKEIPSKKTIESTTKKAVTKETKQQDATVGDTSEEREAPGRASVKEIVPKETMPEAVPPKAGLPKKKAEKIESAKESATQKTTVSKAVDFPQPTSASTPKRMTSSQRDTKESPTQKTTVSKAVDFPQPASASTPKRMTSSPRDTKESVTQKTTAPKAVDFPQPASASTPKRITSSPRDTKESPTQKTTAPKAVDFPQPASASTPKCITSSLRATKESPTQKTTASKAVDFPQPASASTPKRITSSPRDTKESPTQKTTAPKAVDFPQPASASTPKRITSSLRATKESPTQKTTAPKAVDFPQPASASMPKCIASSPRATPSAASPLRLSSSPKLVPQSPVKLQEAAVSKMAMSSLTSPRRSVRSINAQSTTLSTSVRNFESPASILRKTPQDQSPRISSTVSSAEEKTRTPDKTNESSLIKGTIQVTANTRSQIKGAQQATTTTAFTASSANQETGDKTVKPKPSSSMSSSTDSTGKKITAKEVEVVKTSVAEKVKQMKQNIDSSTQNLKISSVLPGSPKTTPFSNVRKVNELVSPSVKRSSPPLKSFDYDPDTDSRDQEGFMNVEELMSGDVIVLDEDSGQDMSGSFEDEDTCFEDKDTHSDHEDIFAGTFGSVDGIYVSEDEILKGEWIVEDTEGEVEEDPETNFEEPGFREPTSKEQEFRDLNSEEPEFEEMDFGVPDFSNMLSIDEVGGSEDEELLDEEVRDDDIDQVEEWEVLSEAEGD